MATSTTRLGLSKPDGADVVDIAVLNANADKLDIAAGAYICTSSTRPGTPWNGQFIYETDTFTALVYKSSTSTWSPLGGSTVGPTPPSGASKGDLWWDSDTGRLYVYYVDANSSQWVAASNSSTNTVGLVPIIPPTVNISGGAATANTSGVITFSGVTSVSLNNVFTSAYTNYEVLIYGLYGSVDNENPSFRYRVGGVDNSSAQYYMSGVTSQNSNGVVSGWGVGAGTSFDIGRTRTGGAICLSERWTIYNPAISGKQTQLHGGGFWENSSSPYGFTISGSVNNTTAYDGFTVYPSSGNFTGSIQVFGYNS